MHDESTVQLGRTVGSEASVPTVGRLIGYIIYAGTVQQNQQVGSDLSIPTEANGRPGRARHGLAL
jgi:hypothetical protein